MQLAHTGDDGLPGFLIGVGLKGGIFLSQLGQGNAHLLLAGLGLRLNGHPDHRLGEDHGLQDNGVVLIAEGVASGGVLDTHSCSDVAGVHHVDVLPVIGVHLQNPAQTLSGVLGGVHHGRALGQSAGVYPEETQLTHEGICGNLKGQSGEGSIVRGRTEVLLVGFGVDALDALFIQGRGHIVHHCVQHFLNALVLVRGATGDRNHGVVNGGLPNGCFDPVHGNLFTGQVQLHDFVVHLGHGFHQLLPVFAHQVLHTGRNLFLPHVLTQLIVEHVGLHLQEVNHALEISLRADGKLNGNRIALQPVVHHIQHAVEVCTHDVHLIDVHHPGNLVLVGLTPHGLGLRLDTTLGAQNRHGTVQDTQGPLHLHGEVHVTRGINDVNPAALPEAGGSSGGNGDAPLLLLGHPVHSSRPIMGFADFIGPAGIEQDALGGCGLAGVNVRHDADISSIFKRVLSWHGGTPLLPAEVGECLVGLRHFMGILALLHRCAGIVVSVHDFSGQPLSHGAFAPLTAVSGDPAQTHGLAPGGADFDGHLVGGAAHAAGLDLHSRHDIFHGLLEDFQSVFAELFLDNFKRTIDDLLGYALLAVQHDAVDELCNQNGIVNGVRENLSLRDVTSSGHFASLLHIKMIS